MSYILQQRLIFLFIWEMLMKWFVKGYKSTVPFSNLTCLDRENQTFIIQIPFSVRSEISGQ